jgi:hypothetical protein
MGLITTTQTTLRKAIAAEQPIHLLHALPREWANPKMWIPLGPLALKSESASQITVELSGQTEDRVFASERFLLPPLTRVISQMPFFSISSIHVDGPPAGRVGIHSTTRNETHVIQTGEWGNIWVYGMDLYLVGWISRAEFRQRAAVILPGSRVLQYDRTRVKNLALPVRELHSLNALLEKVRAWKGGN